MHASGITIDDPIASAIPAVSAQSALEDKLSIFMITDDGASGYVGASSGFSLFSPQGLRWISEKTGNNSFERVIQGVVQKCDSEQIFPNTMKMVSDGDCVPLPPREEAEEYMNTYFSTFNPAYPLYDRETVEERFRRDYQEGDMDKHRDPAWYASLNIIFLIGRAISRRFVSRDITCERFFNNCSSVSMELMFNSPSLLAVQAMIGMAFITHAGEDPHPAYLLVGVACRLAQAIGLHRRLDGYGLTPQEAKQRRNVFWIAFGLEKGISIRSGRPSVFADDDIGVELPPINPNANQNLDSPDSELDWFRSNATLSLLESRVYSKLYSARSHTKPEIERLKWVGALDTELRQWRDELPIMIRPEHPIRCHAKYLMAVTMMHFAYYNCLVAIHRGSAHHGSWVSTKKSTETARDARRLGLNPRVFESGTICLNAARRIIGLLHHYDREGQVVLAEDEEPRCVFTMRTSKAGYKTGLTEDSLTILPSMCNYYPLSASLTLFAHLLATPHSPTALSDLSLMNCVTSILSTSFAATTNPRGNLHLQLFKEVCSIAASVVAKARGITAEELLSSEEYESWKCQGGASHHGIRNFTGQPASCAEGCSSMVKRESCTPAPTPVTASYSPSDSGSGATTPSHSGGSDSLRRPSTMSGNGKGKSKTGRTQNMLNLFCHGPGIPSVDRVAIPVDTPSPGPPSYAATPTTQTQQMPMSQQQTITGMTDLSLGSDGLRSAFTSPFTPGRGATTSGASFAGMTPTQQLPILHSNAPSSISQPSLSQTNLQTPEQQTPMSQQQSQNQMAMDTSFDFSYNWHENMNANLGNGANGNGVDGPPYNAFNDLEMQDADLPMVFQWDLTDIWGGGGVGWGGTSGMGL